MKALKISLGVLIGLVALFFVIGLLLPKHYAVERSRVIAAPRAEIIDHIIDLEKNNTWSPWIELDPTIKVTYGERKVGEGASYTWTSEDSDDGKYTIVSVSDDRVDTEVQFGPGDPAQGYWLFEDVDGQTKVTWGLSGEAGGIVERYFGVLMDKLAGKDFERGLANLDAMVTGR